MFYDHITIRAKAGDGGRGCVAFRRERGVEFGGPSGGDGGKGGSIILRADEHLRTLIDFRYRAEFRAQRGQLGLGSNMSGKTGEDMVLLVPPGTLVKDAKTGRVIADLVEPGRSVVAARGGRGGRGNQHFTTSVRQAPDWAEPGEQGDDLAIALELRVIADVGLVGLPNAGKSSLLARISAAHPKVADYPFTTLEPNLGVVSLGLGESFAVADLPGLIEGAHEGKGLGHGFLRHVSRNRVLVHVVDVGTEQPAAALKRGYDTIVAEIKAYDASLLDRPRLLVGNKLDLPGAAARFEVLRKHAAKGGLKDAHAISAVTGEGVKPLLRAMQLALKRAPAPEPMQAEQAPAVLVPRGLQRVKVVRDQRGAFLVRGREVERAVAGHDPEARGARKRLAADLDRLGVDAALARAGIRRGDLVRIGSLEFEYVP